MAGTSMVSFYTSRRWVPPPMVPAIRGLKALSITNVNTTTLFFLHYPTLVVIPASFGKAYHP